MNMPVNKDERSVMMRFLFSLFLLHAIGALSSSDELRERALSPQACSEVDFIVDILKLHQATPFCSSFLHIPTATTSVVLPGTTKTITTGTDYRTVYSVPTVTVTTQLIISSTQVNTVLVPTTSITVSTTVTTVTVTQTHSVFSSGAPAPQLQRRDLSSNNEHAAANARSPDQIPSWLQQYASPAISSGCSCLSIPTKTSTITQKPTSTVQVAASGIATVVQSASTVYVTLTAIVVVPATITQPATTVSTTVSTSTTTTTTTITTTVDPCASPGLTFNNGGDISGPIKYFVDTVISAQECCQICYYTATNCIIAEYDSGDNTCLIYATGSNSNPFDPTPMCPNGVQQNFTAGLPEQDFDGIFIIGPCAGDMTIYMS